jgi:ABC-type nitrate/sulfonate/bicarbonate transport system substrate-binding protein
VAHVLYGLLYGVEMGIGSRAVPMAVLMNLSRNGQAITLSRALGEAGVLDGPSLAARMRAAPPARGARRFTFAHTFPTGNHAMFLYYWLAAAGIDPLRDIQAATVPPGQMAASLAAGHIDGFCAGEPWGARAVLDGSGVTVATSQDIWPGHPGKALGATAAFADANPHACRALVAALLEAARWIDASPDAPRRHGRDPGQPRLCERRPRPSPRACTAATRTAWGGAGSTPTRCSSTRTARRTSPGCPTACGS